MANKSSFIGEIVEELLNEPKESLQNYVLIFANKRSGSYFLNFLRDRLSDSVWAPQVFSFEEFVLRAVKGQRADKNRLIFELFEVYSKVQGKREELDQFFYWGEMLLSDFDELDRYMVNPSHLFVNLRDLKALESISYLTDEEKDIIRQFWTLMDDGKSKENWLSFWSGLQSVYEDFKKELNRKGIAYYGMQQRILAENLSEKTVPVNKKYIFAGFNALTKAEQAIMEFMAKERNAQFFWDYDNFYVDSRHEAGIFFRKYRKNKYLSPFLTSQKNLIGQIKQEITAVACSTQHAQVQLIAEQISELADTKDFDPQKTAIVVPDEKMMVPLLSAIPEKIKRLNITMGYSLKYSQIYSLVNILQSTLRNQKSMKGEWKFSVGDILHIIRHPLLKPHTGDLETNLSKYSDEHKVFWYSYADLPSENKILELIYRLQESSILDELNELVNIFIEKEERSWEKVFLVNFKSLIINLQKTTSLFESKMSRDELLRLLIKASASSKVPFSGEPIEGLQIMGVLETRSLDFEHVFVLGMNEDYLPGTGGGQSFIPYSLRKAFGMPTEQDNQALQSYLFYRLIQRCPNVHLYYQDSADPMGGAISRYIHQLKFTYPVSIRFLRESGGVQAISPKLIDVEFPEQVPNPLTRYDSSDKTFSPTAIHSYLECKLKYYFKYLLGVKVDSDPEELFDARLFGSVLHETIEALYKTSDSYLKSEDISDSMIVSIVEEKMREHAGLSNKGEKGWTGNYLLSRDLILDVTRRIIEDDKTKKLDQILSMEGEYSSTLTIGSMKINLAGKIDRVDEKNGSIRIIDYKTGGDESVVGNWEKLFSGNHKGVFQLFLYSLLYRDHENYSGRIEPLLYKTRDIFLKEFDPNIKFNGQKVLDIGPLLPEFEDKLTEILNEIANEAKFEQTEELKRCSYCDFARICRRQND